MFAVSEPGVDHPVREHSALRALARLAALDGILQPPADVLVVQQVRPALQGNLGYGNDPCHEFTHALSGKTWTGQHPRADFLSGFPCCPDPPRGPSSDRQLTLRFLCAPAGIDQTEAEIPATSNGSAEVCELVARIVAMAHQRPAYQRRQAGSRDDRRHRPVCPLPLTPALGQWPRGDRRRHPRQAPREQPARRPAHPLRRLRRYRLSPHSRQLHRPVHQFHPVPCVGGHSHPGRADEEPLRDPARYAPCGHPRAKRYVDRSRPRSASNFSIRAAVQR